MFDPYDPETMRRFLRDYQQVYATYVEEARELARTAPQHDVIDTLTS